jgi:hypothetical protein
MPRRAAVVKLDERFPLPDFTNPSKDSFDWAPGSGVRDIATPLMYVVVQYKVGERDMELK